MKIARLKDVAQRAGVALNTASAILNGRSDSWASAKTRQRVIDAAKELDYRANPSARGIRLGRSQAIGLIIPDLNNPFFSALAAEVELAVEKHGSALLIEHARLDIERELHCVDSLVTRQVDGIIGVFSDINAHQAWFGRPGGQKLPLVVCSAKVSNPPAVDCIMGDVTLGLQHAVAYLVSLGHTRLGFIRALAKGQVDGLRQDIFEEVARAQGIQRENITSEACGPTMEEARLSFVRLLERSGAHRPTAIIALNDLSAIGVMRSALECGLKVPGDLSIVGIDDIPMARYLPIALTTVHQPCREIAERAVETLFARILGTGPAEPVRCVVESRLIPRESTAPPRAVG